MERRNKQRKSVNLKAERLSCIEKCSVFIENISEDGIYMLTAPESTDLYVPGKEIDLELELSSGETINLNCNVKWAYNDSAEDKTNSVGLEIVDPPQKYKEFLKTIH